MVHLEQKPEDVGTHFQIPFDVGVHKVNKMWPQSPTEHPDHRWVSNLSFLFSLCSPINYGFLCCLSKIISPMWGGGVRCRGNHVTWFGPIRCRWKSLVIAKIPCKEISLLSPFHPFFFFSIISSPRYTLLSCD